MKPADVLIVGAGPTGLVLALWLTKLGVAVRIVDKTAEPGTTSRALAIHARTLELYRQLDLADAVVDRGHLVPAVNLWVKGERATRIAFGNVGQNLTSFPFLEIFPQDEHERLLIERLEQSGVRVERRTELTHFVDEGDQLLAHLRRPDGSVEICEARYLAGCDGAHSIVRKIMGAGFPGALYRQLFYVADVEAAGPAIDGELHVDLDEADFLAVFPLAGQGRARLIGTVRDERATHAELLKFEDVSRRAIEHMNLDVRRLNWFSTYHVHHRVAERFRAGRAFLLGDAGHIHSPAGGQGMNTGIGDAINLAWKLATVLRGAAPEALLDSYEAERIGFARRLVQTTDRVFTFATAEGRIADLLRTRVAPTILSVLASIAPLRKYVFETVSQLSLNYRDSSLSEGVAGAVRGGDRLPWAPLDDDDNFTPLSSLRWQAHVYGTAKPTLSAWCARRDLPLHVFEWTERHAEAGLARDALYLVRPDAYVGLAALSAGPENIEQYLASRSLVI